MTGDERARFCSQCSLHVYNLSEMTRSEAEALIAEKEGRLCVRYYRRKDGTMLTQDCPVGSRSVKEQRARSIRRVVTAGAAILAGVVGLEASQMSPRSETGGDEQVEVQVVGDEQAAGDEQTDNADEQEAEQDEVDESPVIMGIMVIADPEEEPENEHIDDPTGTSDSSEDVLSPQSDDAAHCGTGSNSDNPDIH
jgi:hypothetical protein